MERSDASSVSTASRSVGIFELFLEEIELARIALVILLLIYSLTRRNPTVPLNTLLGTIALGLAPLLVVRVFLSLAPVPSWSEPSKEEVCAQFVHLCAFAHLRKLHP